MSNKLLYICWGFLYAITAAFGFIVGAEGFAYGVLIFFALLFFLPPAVLLSQYIKAGNRKGIKILFWLSVSSLVLTMILFIANILAVGSSAATGFVMYVILVVVSAPMYCGQIQFISLFLWACLLMACVQNLRKK